MKPLRLDIKKKLAQRSERVKFVDLHPSEPWILASLYSGSVCIWNYQSQRMVKSFEVTELPVRSAKFIARKQWVVAGDDDMYIRILILDEDDRLLGLDFERQVNSIMTHLPKQCRTGLFSAAQTEEVEEVSVRVEVRREAQYKLDSAFSKTPLGLHLEMLAVLEYESVMIYASLNLQCYIEKEVCDGAKSEQQSKLVARKYTRIIQKFSTLSLNPLSPRNSEKEKKNSLNLEQRGHTSR